MTEIIENDVNSTHTHDVYFYYPYLFLSQKVIELSIETL